MDGVLETRPFTSHEGVVAVPDDEDEKQRRIAYWKANLWLIFGLLIVWFLVSYLFGILLVEWLNNFYLGSIPLGFWFAQQGSIYVFVVLIFVYAIGMDRLAEKYDVVPKEEDEL